jgi:diguanylate cyclase (GGDEF)-like protein
MSYPNVATILIIDDSPNNIKIIFDYLETYGYKILVAQRGETGIEQAKNALPNLILLDVIMPGIDGFETCKRLKSLPETKDIPVIFMTGLSDTEHKVAGLSLGAVDYVTKPFNQQEILARIKLHLRLQELNHTLQVQNNLLQQEINARILAEQSLKELNQQLEARINEKTAKLRQANKQLYYQAFHDSLTGLPNRAYFLKKLQKIMQLASEQDNYFYAVLFIDLNRFKLINDSLGHEVGDELLIEVAKRIESCCLPNQIMARFGGDEFLIVATINNLTEIENLTKSILDKFKAPFLLKKHKLYSELSIGITSNLLKSYQTSAEIIKDADLAMYRAKNEKRYIIFNPDQENKALIELELDTDLHKAIENQEFCLYYQPIISLSTGLLFGFEALLRWQHPSRGLILPEEFIPMAEETGLINPMGIWVLEEACQQKKVWLGDFPDFSSLRLHINISPVQLKQPNLLKQLQGILQQNNLDGKYINLGIKESKLLETYEHNLIYLQQIQDSGIGICIDDFGLGYSNLNYLPHFPLHTIKINQRLINTSIEKANHQLIQIIINLAHNLQVQVVGEGISNMNELKLWQQLGCQLGQGYFFAEAVDSQTATKFLRRGKEFNWLADK